MKKVKWGIIGLGSIAHKFAEAITKMNNVELYSVASRNKEKSESFGSLYGVKEELCYSSYENLVNNPEIDVIYIAVPHSLHKLTSILCLNHKKAVLCEKPVSLNAKESEEIIACAKLNNVFFMEAMKTRFLPVHKKVKEVIESGIIGEPRLLQANFGFYAEFDEKSRLFDLNLGGGALLDVGIYLVSYSSYLFGNKPSRIFSSSHIGKSSVDENISINLSYDNGVEAQLYAAINLNTKRDANIVGTKGIITIPHFSNSESFTLSVDNTETVFPMPFQINGFEYQIEEVNNCLRNNKTESEIMSWNDSLEIMEIMDKIKNFE